MARHGSARLGSAQQLTNRYWKLDSAREIAVARLVAAEDTYTSRLRSVRQDYAEVFRSSSSALDGMAIDDRSLVEVQCKIQCRRICIDMYVYI